MKLSRPYITMSFAQSADGRIATAAGLSRYISGAESLEFAHGLRRDNDAVLVGVGTVIKDDPLLTCRLPDDCADPIRIVLDSRLRTPPGSRLVRSAREVRTIIFTCDTDACSRREALLEAGVEVEALAAGAGGRPDLVSVLSRLAEMGVESLFVEGGAGIITAFIGAGQVDRLFLVSAPVIIGKGVEAVGDLHTEDLDSAPRGRTVSLRRAGEDVIWEIVFDEYPPEQASQSERTYARAIYFTAPGKLEVREVEIGRGGKEALDGKTLVRSKLIGISHGTERHIWKGSFPRGLGEDGLESLSGRMDYPLRYGYMNAGRSEDGDKVFAFFPHQDRFYADEEQLLRFPEEADFEDIVLYPSVETAYTVVTDAGVLPGERVLIIGQGVVGLLAAEMLRAFCGDRLATLETIESRRERSEELGIRSFSPDDGDALERLHSYWGVGADKIINLSASGEGLQAGIDFAEFGAVVIEASWYGSGSVSLRLGEAFHRRRLSIKSSQVSSLPDGFRGRWPRSRRTSEAKRLTMELHPSKYITHRYSLADASRAYGEIFSGSGEILQAVFVP